MGTGSDAYLYRPGSPWRAAGGQAFRIGFAQPWVDSSRVRAKVNCEFLTPAVVLQALRDVESGRLSKATPDRRTPLAQGLIALASHFSYVMPKNWILLMSLVVLPQLRR